MGDETLLLERILNGEEDPKDLPLALLQSITNDFSDNRKIGQGGFGVVYKGVLRNGIIVAVKRMYVNQHTVDDRSFRREINSLMKINHQNVVRFLGFCSHAYHTSIKEAGSTDLNFINVRERLLCLEYINNGSLDKHITDELRGFEWKTRYEIIMGICKGLCYLHKETEIVHMDLKPANILLDDHMVPKLTDFGLSRPNENSHTMGQRFGTRGYLAPEYENAGKTSVKSDIYSLGAIIIELVTGCMSVPDKINVLRRWRHRWNKPPTLLQYQQVTRCIDIAVRCRQQEPGHRPSISEIISILSEPESTNGHTDQVSPCFDEDDMLGIKPLELHLPSELKEEISCFTVQLTNDTRNYIAFNIQLLSGQRYSAQPYKGIVQPESKCGVKIIVQARDVHEHAHADKFIVQSMKVSKGHRYEDITERMFEEASEVVDEVNLIVVYEPAKPQENCKSREDANMPAEEVPKAKKRKIVESASVKGKLVSSENVEASLVRGMREHCTEQTEQCKFYTPQSFSRHYPTNTTYLGKGSQAVDVTRGAMGSLLDKLGKLVKEDYNLERSMKRDIESFSEDLAKIHTELPNLGKLDGVEIWVDEVRELSYNIEDMIDSFVVCVEPASSRSGFRELRHEGLKFLENDMTTQRQIGDVIRDIKNQVQAVADRKKKYNFNVNNVAANATAKADIDLRISAIYEDKEQLIGIGAPRDELIRLFNEDGNVSKLKTISIVGLGGLGKTTLAKAVYDKLKAQYHPKTFVPVGQNPDVKTILKNIIIDCQSREYNAERLEYLDARQLINELQKLLEDKRYFIVIDDIWDSSSWDLIASAFPKNNHGSRVITTTRIERVALDCCKIGRKYVYRMKSLGEEDSRRLFFRRIFGPEKDCPDTPRKEEISKYILKKCGGMPLAINSIASLLAHDESESTWEYVWKSLGSVTEGDDLEKMKQILDLSYIHLPDPLKTCLLYVCMYPEDREIEKNDLVRLWVAEGFVSANSGPDAEDVANKYFNDLISMSMLQPGETDASNNEVLSCRVHDIMLDLLKSKSSKENFIRVIDDSKYGTGKIRRVSFHNNDKNYMRIFETINKESLSQVRSVLLCRSSLAAYFLEKFKYVRVLHLERDNDFNNSLDLTGISKLFLLRYLKIACPHGGLCELKLPNQIGELQQLETIDLQGCYMEKYPSDIVSLPWLSHLSMTGIIAGVVLPDGIDRLTSLRTLAGVRLYESSVDSILGLGKLTNLRKLEICLYTGEGEAITARHMDALRSSISILSTSLMICTFKERFPLKYVLGWSSRTLFPGDSQIRELHLGGCIFRRCPKCIRQLHKLYKFSIWVREVADGISIVAGLRSLAYFSLMTCNIWAKRKEEREICVWEEGKEERVVIPGTGSGAFQALKEFIFCCKNASLTFEAGAMPKLERLEIEFRYHMTAQFLPVDIQHLPAPTVKQICLRVAHNDMEVEGSQDWNSDDRFNYYLSDEYVENLRQHDRTVRALLMGAFKPHYPGADIVIQFEEGFDEEEDDENEDETRKMRMMKMTRKMRMMKMRRKMTRKTRKMKMTRKMRRKMTRKMRMLKMTRKIDEDDEDEEEDDEEDEDDEDEEEDDEEDEDDEDDEEDDEDDEEDDGKGVGDEEYCWEQKLVQHCRPVDVEDPVDAAGLAALEVELSKLLQNNEDVEAISTNSPS